ncbi:hypothetical protein EHS25_003954 [Saitozyma podzolica]|uniref:Uncharacterized protein n=1 Tax=Saitozyma podzolica TaxID=1890683 RepID=A0A427YT04_9TREE|nr:hypothetical protein EHS25_003954 [Saitozyma podzolica]
MSPTKHGQDNQVGALMQNPPYETRPPPAPLQQMNLLPEYPYTKHNRQDQEERDRRRQAIKEFKQVRAMLREAQQQERPALRREGLTGWARVNAFRQMQYRHSHDLEELEAQFSAQARERELVFVVVIGVVGRRVLQNEEDREAVCLFFRDVVAMLRDKHPAGAADPFGPTDGPSSGDIRSEEEILAAFKTFKQDTSPGLSGWTHHLLATALRVPVFLKAIHTLTGLIMAGTAPGQAMLCASRLTPLRKPDGGLRPIAVGDMINRLATKAIIRHSNRRDFLLRYQFVANTARGNRSNWSMPAKRATCATMGDTVAPTPLSPGAKLRRASDSSLGQARLMNRFADTSRQEMPRVRIKLETKKPG